MTEVSQRSLVAGVRIQGRHNRVDWMSVNEGTLVIHPLDPAVS